MGCSIRKQMLSEEIASVVSIKGIPTFRPERFAWPHPVGVIGAGYNGLKTAMIYAKAGNENFVVFDRNDKVGGYCWITAANKGSKLQTEFGSFHIWWGQDLVTEKCPYPKGWEIWPKKDKVLAHFQHAAEAYGVLDKFQFKTNVAKLDVMGEKDKHDRYYKLAVHPVEGGDTREVSVSILYNFPGCMTRNRIIEYPGEDIFEGHIAYGMNDDCPYHELKGQQIAILGNGAFAVENDGTLQAASTATPNHRFSGGLLQRLVSVMELRVESVDGFALPKNCFIGVRVGEVLKQGRYEPNRCYNFPQLDRRRNAKVDIYQHVGTCMIPVDPDTKSSHEVTVTSMDPELPGSRVRINVQAKSEDSRQQREERTKALKVQARDYLMKHSVEERLSEAVKALLKEQPADATAFLCKQLMDWDAKPAPKTKPAQEPTAPEPEDVPQVFEDEGANRLRLNARETFLRATEDGSLERVLSGVRKPQGEVKNKDGGAAAPADPKEALRAKASKALITAAENGKLEEALATVRKDGSEEKNPRNVLRIKASQTLIAAAENGKLEEALSAVKKKDKASGAASADTDPTDQMRAEAVEILMAAADNGQLEAALKGLVKEGAPDQSEQMREQAVEILMAAAENGQLEVALQALTKDANQKGKERAWVT
ncbi:unnamed protein product [Effrenium voratum]|nr:unnamed protein product [Effrenium voratum]